WLLHLRLPGVMILCLAMISLSSQGYAQETQQSEEDFLAGVAAYETGNYGDAVLAFQKSFFKKRRPNLAFNIAMSYERLKDLESAIGWYKQYRSLRTIDELGINRRIASLEAMSVKLPTASKALAKSKDISAEVNPFKATALGVGVVGLATASILGSMATYYSGRSAETSDFKRQGVYARNADTYAFTTDITLLLSLAGLVYGGTDLFDTSTAD
ncbi:MAG: tetratricopeptide repeat protein, partial [Bradymonadia bacterium]